MMRTRVKICGIRDPHMAEVAVNAGADAIGVVLAERSPRRVTVATAHEIARATPPDIAVVAVVSSEDAWIAAVEGWKGPVQLHGPWVNDEHRITGLIRGFPWSASAARAADTVPEFSALLIDGPSGGGGVPFDHKDLGSVMAQLTKPVIVAGGLTADTVSTVIRSLRPYAVDVSSGVETAPGVKDPGAIRAFCAAVHASSG